MMNDAGDDFMENEETTADEAEESKAASARSDELSKNKNVREQMQDIFDEIERGFSDQGERANDQLDYWDVYNCKLTGKQFYTGNSKIFVPIVHNAVNARKTRFTNQIFPQSGRYVEATSEDGTIPHALIALLENYVRVAKLRTKVMPALMRNGDVEGQYSIYVSWESFERQVTHRSTVPLMSDDGADTGETIDSIEEEIIEVGRPTVDVLSDMDVLILPQTADTVEEALRAGGSATIIRRWSKAQIRAKMADGDLPKAAGKALLDSMGRMQEAPRAGSKLKKMLDAAGIEIGDADTVAAVYETWAYVKVRGEKQLCRMYFGGEEVTLSCKRNPYWCDKVPLFSVPVEKVQGAFKGRSKVAPVADLQYFANDTINEAADSAAYSLMPIVMTDPEKNPRIGSMILSMAAIWETSPNDTQFAKFPEMWRDGLQLVGATKDEIFQTLGVNPAMVPQMGIGAQNKRNQAMIAQEQQVDILATADAVTVVEEGILTPMLQFMLELDHQYRDKDITVRQYGEMGVQANMQEVPPVQMDMRYQFRWFGVEAARNAQQVQQQIAGMNVIRGIPPEQLNGYKVNLVPIVTQLVENTFGPRLAPLIFQSPEQQMPVPVEQENMLLMSAFDVPVHQMDDDNAHIQAHMALLQGEGGKHVRKVQAHIFQHMQQKAKKEQAAMAMAQGQQGMPGIPGGAGPGDTQPAPGVAGTPRMGAQVDGPRTQGPPGMIPQDQLRDPAVMPRKM